MVECPPLGICRPQASQLVNAGEYATKSEFIRFAGKQLLYSEQRVGKLEAVTSKLQKQTMNRR